MPGILSPLKITVKGAPSERRLLAQPQTLDCDLARQDNRHLSEGRTGARRSRLRKVGRNMQTEAPRTVAVRHRLLPHERWAARYVARQSAPQGSMRWRKQQNYGPDGVTLLSASQADLVAGIVAVWIGVGLGLLTVIGWYIFGIGMFVLLVGLSRSIQAGRAGRRYRNGRPFMRPRDP